MAQHLDAELVATEIRNTRWFDSSRKTEAARHLFQDRLTRISDMAADHGVEIADVRQKASTDQPKDIMKIARDINPNMLITGTRGATTGQGLMTMTRATTRRSLSRQTARLTSLNALQRLLTGTMPN